MRTPHMLTLGIILQKLEVRKNPASHLCYTLKVLQQHYSVVELLLVPLRPVGPGCDDATTAIVCAIVFHLNHICECVARAAVKFPYIRFERFR